MKTLRKYCSKLYVIVPTCVLILIVTSCSEERIETKIDFTNEEIFSGIFFLSGPFYEQVPMLNRHNMSRILDESNVTESYGELQENIIGIMKKNGFSFDEFGSAIRSKDPRQIVDMLEVTSKVYLEAFHEWKPVDLTKIARLNPERLINILNKIPELEDPQSIAVQISSGKMDPNEIHNILSKSEELMALVKTESTENGKVQVTPGFIFCVVAVVGAVAAILFIEAAVAVDFEVCLWEGVLESFGSSQYQDPKSLESKILVRQIVDIL